MLNAFICIQSDFVKYKIDLIKNVKIVNTTSINGTSVVDTSIGRSDSIGVRIIQLPPFQLYFLTDSAVLIPCCNFGTVIPKLLQSSGDPELDRKALEPVSRRKYEASEDGDRTTIRVTSQ